MQKSCKIAGADLGFSRGGGGHADFQKKIENFVDVFFRSAELIFELSLRMI